MRSSTSIAAAVTLILSLAAVARAQHNFQSSELLLIPQNGSMGPSNFYPSRKAATGVRRPIASVRVFLQTLIHSYPDDLDVVLVSPRGLAVVLMSDAGGSTDFSGTLIFQHGASPIPDTTPLVSDLPYGPADHEPGDPPPNLPPVTFTTLAGLAGSDANGYWRLYVYDDGVNDLGQMGAFQLEITEAASGPLVFDEQPATEFVLPDVSLLQRTMRVSGIEGTIQNMMVRLSGLRHTFPNDLEIAVTDPSGRSYILMSDVGGSTPVNNLEIEFVTSGPPVPTTSLASGRYRGTDRNDGSQDLVGAIGLETSEGRHAGGEWKLTLLDDASGDSGAFAAWSLTFNPPCAGDFDRSGSVGVQDIFSFLVVYFAGCP